MLEKSQQVGHTDRSDEMPVLCAALHDPSQEEKVIRDVHGDSTEDSVDPLTVSFS